MSSYDIENYLSYDKAVGMYDSLSNDFIARLKKIPVSRSIDLKNRMLDAISKEIYGTELLWWVLSFYNDILDPLNMNRLTIYAPSREDLEAFLLGERMSNVSGK